MASGGCKRGRQPCRRACIQQADAISHPAA
uniref:Uncharacterized protein n=1 Tax=Siphoviridae sp. ct4Am4 TaxID=2826287 RepID=A0A8S5R2G3_9CAUD|nr:MAG TPA: hypothetical protein [Siphoviridae sp. ct4Am4]DAE44460.1 MAG TPA: hypothetical protein [Bacteriophage sp.]